MPAAAGPLWVGGMAFAPDGGSTPPWSSLPPGAAGPAGAGRSARRDGSGWVTLCAIAGAGTSPPSVRERAGARLGSLREAPLPPLDPHPSSLDRGQQRSAARRLRGGGRRRGRRIRVGLGPQAGPRSRGRRRAPSAHSAPALFDALRQLFDPASASASAPPRPPSSAPQPRAAGPPRRRRRLDRRARRLGPAQRRPCRR